MRYAVRSVLSSIFVFPIVFLNVCYGSGKNEIDSLIAVLKDRDARVKAVEALGDIGDTSVVELLIECLDDRDENVRFKAIISLGKIGDKRAVEPLCMVLHSSKDIPIILRFASYGLPIAVPSSSTAPSIAEDSTARDGDILKAAEWSLEKIGEEAVPFLIEGLGDESVNVRYLVLETLRDINDSRIIDPFIDLLEDEDEYIRANAIQALGKMGDKKVIQPLKKMLEDESELVRKAAAVAIKELGKKGKKQ